MEQFKIVKLHDEPYDFLIIAASYENPFDHFSEIKEKNFSSDCMPII